MVFWWRLGGVTGNDDGDEGGDDDDGLGRSDISGLAMNSVCHKVISVSTCWPSQLTRSGAPRDLSSPSYHPCRPRIPSTRPSA